MCPGLGCAFVIWVQSFSPKTSKMLLHDRRAPWQPWVDDPLPIGGFARHLRQDKIQTKRDAQTAACTTYRQPLPLPPSPSTSSASCLISSVHLFTKSAILAILTQFAGALLSSISSDLQESTALRTVALPRGCCTRAHIAHPYIAPTLHIALISNPSFRTCRSVIPTLKPAQQRLNTAKSQELITTTVKHRASSATTPPALHYTAVSSVEI